MWSSVVAGACSVVGHKDYEALGVVQSQQGLGEEVACLLFAEDQVDPVVPRLRALRDPLDLASGLTASSVDPDQQTCPLASELAEPVVGAVRTAVCCWQSQQVLRVAQGVLCVLHQASKKLVHLVLAGLQVGEQLLVLVPQEA